MRVDTLSFIINIVIVAYSAYKALKYIKERRRRRRRFWVREIYQDREMYGFFSRTFHQIEEKDPETFRMATRMNINTFNVLYNLLEDSLTKYSIRTPISAKCRLFLTLVYLAHGGSRQFFSLSFKMGLSTVRKITLDTCDAIWDALFPIYLSQPNTNEWERIAEDFENIWNLPNCVGAIDGKHINITCPPNSGSLYYNYKGTYSIVLLAVCDANYTFTSVDIGAYGSQSDGGVLSFSNFGRMLLQGQLDLPKHKQLRNSTEMFPYFFVGDAAFPLKPYLMRPYPGLLLSEERQNFNKRLSRARRTIENAFGILTARWRILRSTLNMHPESAEKIVKASVVLHNFIKMTDSSYCPPDFTDHYEGDKVIEGLWRKEVRPLDKCKHISSNNASKTAFQLRDILCDYVFLNK